VSGVDGEFFHAAIRSRTYVPFFTQASDGVRIGQWDLAEARMKEIPFFVPPFPEQAAIVRFLDHADRLIRRYIRAKQKLITLLEEQKQAIIHHAVTRGLDPDVRFKPSGVEWLGDVPEHWEVVRLGRLIQLTTGFPFKSEGFSQQESDIRLLRGINIAPGKVRWEEVVRWPDSQSTEFADYALRVGDVALGMDRPIISDGVRAAKIGASDVPSLLLQRVARIRAHADLDIDFALYLISGKSFADYLAPIFTGISVPHISPEQIESFRIALPSPTEQLQIVDWLKSSTAIQRASIGAETRGVDLLREYRTRLIADVVTGKLDVREAAANLPDEADEAEALDDADALGEGNDDTIDDDLHALPEEPEG
jgi:type I restriction enzyme S subunit